MTTILAYLFVFYVLWSFAGFAALAALFAWGDSFAMEEDLYGHKTALARLFGFFVLPAIVLVLFGATAAEGWSEAWKDFRIYLKAVFLGR